MTRGARKGPFGAAAIHQAGGINVADTIPSAPPDTDQTWTTEQLREDFVVEGFSMGICVVKRKSDGLVGTLDFGGHPRVYHSFVAHDGPECGNGVKP